MSIQWIIFLAVTACLSYLSRASLRVPRSHGFYRFFGWEAILGLILLNVMVWFRDPYSWYQVISWVCLIISLLLAIHGFYLLHQLGKQNVKRDDAPLLEFEKTTHLITTGAYRYIRHPLYSSLVFLAIGVFFKSPSLPGGSLLLAAFLFLTITARMEEIENIHFFGPAYREYMQKTKMFIPFIF